jgi:hypothetical protein
LLFEQRFFPGLADGSVTMTFRRWKRRQVVPGHRYRTPAGMLEVDTVDVVDPATIGDDEARRSGYPTAAALVADLRGEADLPTYRIGFHHAGPDPRDALAGTDELSPEDRAELERRLARLDRAAPGGPWTAATLAVIAANPGVRAGDLAESLGRQRAPFKLDVRKLKGLGLTISLDVGYELSPRGRAFLLRDAAPA